MKINGVVSNGLFLLLLSTYAQMLQAQPVIQCPDPGRPLAERWKWATQEAGHRGLNHGFWIGYSIVKLMGENSFTGRFYSDARRNKPSLCELLGLGPCIRERGVNDAQHGFTMMEGTVRLDDGANDENKVPKELGILFEIPQTSAAGEPFSTVTVSNLSLHVDIGSRPLLWLGSADDSASVTLLKQAYDQGVTEKIQREVIEAVGLHEPSPAVTSFLAQVLKEAKEPTVREESAIWLGQTNSDQALKDLFSAAENDNSSRVREKAIFSLSEMEGDKGTESLITLARSGKEHDVRNKAMFWLGQKASAKATATLKDIVENDEDTEVQKNALFALTQLPGGSGIDAVINVAKTHRNPRVRKEAIFWLGQSEDKRALDVLIDIVRK